MPVLAKTAATYGITAAEIARASTYLLIGMNNVTLGELTKKALLPSNHLVAGDDCCRHRHGRFPGLSLPPLSSGRLPDEG